MPNYNTLKYVSIKELLSKVKEVYSIAGLLRAFNLTPAGGNYDTIKKRLKELNADTLHWTGQGWTLGHQSKDIEEYQSTSQLKKHLIRKLGHKCQCCHLDKWLNEKITLELEHIDGDKYNNKEDNLSLLCPNCHSKTKTWRRRKVTY